MALVEGQDLAKSQHLDAASPDYSNRCSSLTPGSVNFLRDIGAWQHVAAARVQPYHSMQVWDGVSGSSINFDPSMASTSLLSPALASDQNPSASNTVAYMTENPNLVSALLTHLATLDPITTFSNTRVSHIDLGADFPDADLSTWPVLTLSNSRRLAARLLIGADGFNSPVRAFAGIASRGWDYARHGVVATLDMPGPGLYGDSHRTAYQRFLPTGPIALLPLPGNRASLVWSTTPANAAFLKSLDPADFTAMVNAAFRLLPADLAYMHTQPPGTQAAEFSWREPNTLYDPAKVPQKAVSTQPASVAAFPLRMRHADTYTAHRVALLGDAAHTVHPLAGQGLNLGLSDAAALAATLGDALAVGADIGACWALDPYNARQWARNNTMLGAVDKLHKLYSASSGPVVWARSLGLTAVDKLAPLKGFLMGRATGL